MGIVFQVDTGPDTEQFSGNLFACCTHFPRDISLVHSISSSDSSPRVAWVAGFGYEGSRNTKGFALGPEPQ